MTPTIADNIRRIAEEKGLKHKAIAKKAGFSQQQFSAMLNGRKLILPEYILPIARALGSTPNDIYGFDVDESA